MASLNSIDHSRWPEVFTINRYAVFMGYQTMAVRGLGFLMLTWAVSVLLGGFVPDLGDTDFNFLAVITFLQAARVFNFILKERTSDIKNSLTGLLVAVIASFLRLLSCIKKKGKTLLGICYVLIFVVVFVQLWPISSFVLYPLAILYVPGIWISVVLSILRLRVHDYGIAKAEVRKHLTLALTILYSLGVAQGAFSLLGLWDWVARPGLAEAVAGIYGLNVQLVSEYVDETVTGCMKDPSFARGRNLVTYGVDCLLLMESTSTTTTSSSSRGCSKYLSGLTILGSILQRDTDTCWWLRRHRHRDASGGGLIRESAKELNFYGFYGNPEKLSLLEKLLLCFITGRWRRINPPAVSVHGGQPAVQLMKQLLVASASFGQLIQRLLETLGPGSPYSGEVREHAARILAEVAGSVRLEQFAGATRCISSSLLDTFEEHCWRPEGYERDGDLPEEYERDWLLEEQERSYVLLVGHWRRRLRFLRLLVKKPFHCVAAMANGDTSPPPQVPPESDDGEKSRSLLRGGYVGLVVSGLRVLQALAASEDNCRFISCTRGGSGEVSRTMMRPLASDGLHRDHHDEWCMIAEESLNLLSRLMAAPGETGKALRVQIAGDTAGAVAALETVFGCPRCQVALKRQAVEVLLGLPPPVDTSSILVSRGSSTSNNNNTRIIFMGILLHIFLLPDKHFGSMFGPTHLLKKRSCTRRLAGEKLLAMVSALQQPSGGDDDGGGATATSMLQAAGVALDNLTSTVVVAGNDASWRIHAARILEDLCQDYTKDDEYLKEIKKAMCAAMPEVLKQVLHGCVSTTQAVTENVVVGCQAPAAGTDLEQGVVSDDTIGEETVSSPHQQPEDEQEQPAEGTELYQALVSLCHGIPNIWIDTDKDLASELNGIAAETCAKEGMPFHTFISLRAELNA